MEAASYLRKILKRMEAKWPEIRARLTASYGDHPELADDAANFAEAALASLAVGFQTLDRTVDPERAGRLRTEIRTEVVRYFGTESAGEILAIYEELWQRTRDARGLGMGFIMRILGEEPSPSEDDDQLIRYKTETLVGGDLLEGGMGVFGTEWGAGSRE